MPDTLLFRQLGFPVLQNRVYVSPEAARRAVSGDVELVQCQQSGLVYNKCFDAGLLQYDRHYQNEQACSPTFQRHLGEVLDILVRNIKAEDQGIEIGCGKGTFFEMMRQAGANVLGFDPAYEGSSLHIRKEAFGPGSVEIAPDFIVLRHVLEHLVVPWEFLSQLKTQCKAGTKIYIEVPCFDWIVDHDAFYDIFYEHVNYFTLDVLASAFSCIEAGRFFGGQYLFLVADLSSFQVPRNYAGRRFRELDVAGYVDSLDQKRRATGRRPYIWGAGAKGVTLANMFAKRRIAVQSLIDINPAKQGMFSAGAGTPIKAPGDVIPELGGADVFVMNPIYLKEIASTVQAVTPNLIPVT